MRTKNSIKNIGFGIGAQLLSTILSFASRTVFIYVLGTEYLGVNGLFSNILSMLSLAELGVGSAIIYNMYKPLADKDEEQLKALMKLYSRAYTIIGIIVAVIGVAITPFLDTIIHDKPNIDNLTIIYLLFLGNSVASYFYAYKSSIIIADQKNYIVTVKQQIYTLIQVAIQIIVLLLTKNYILYLLVQVVLSFMVNLSIAKKADELYPFLKDKNSSSLDEESKKIIFRHVRATMSHKFGGVVVNSTDNILISSFVGVYWVGLYSNYVMIIGIVSKFLNQIFTAITASVGNLNAKENKEKSYEVFKKIFFVNFWLYSFCSICLWILFNPFIIMWLGEKYTMSEGIVLLIVVNFFLMGMRQATITYNSTLGLFWNDRYKPWFEAIINLVVSIIMLKKYGIAGVFIGTFVSTVTTSLWVDPYILFKHGFHKKLSLYFIKYTQYVIMTILAGWLTKYVCSFVDGYTFMSIMLRGTICLIIPNILFVVLCFRMDEFKYFKNMIETIVKSKLKKRVD